MRGVFCTRHLSEDLDGSPRSVIERLKSIIPDSEIYCLNQVHSDRIVFAEDIRSGEIPEADGIISRNPDTILCIRTADCVPVFLYDEDSGFIAAVHAGWRGLAKGIVKKAISRMQSLGARNIQAGIGPSIGQCCYEIGSDVIEALGVEPTRYEDGSIFIDLCEVTLAQILDADLRQDMVNCVRLCTSCNPEMFFSYRRDGASAGRNISAIGGKSWLLPGLQAE